MIGKELLDNRAILGIFDGEFDDEFSIIFEATKIIIDFIS